MYIISRNLRLLLQHLKGCGSKLGGPRNLERGNGYSLFHLSMIKEGILCCTGSHWQGHLKEMRRPWQLAGSAEEAVSAEGRKCPPCI